MTEKKIKGEMSSLGFQVEEFKERIEGAMLSARAGASRL